MDQWFLCCVDFREGSQIVNVFLSKTGCEREHVKWKKEIEKLPFSWPPTAVTLVISVKPGSRGFHKAGFWGYQLNWLYAKDSVTKLCIHWVFWRKRCYLLCSLRQNVSAQSWGVKGNSVWVNQLSWLSPTLYHRRPLSVPSGFTAIKMWPPQFSEGLSRASLPFPAPWLLPFVSSQHQMA